ncbi:MAG: Gfo/Idh/MocA family oxidoreductase [Blastocatellia bacterium]
MSKLRWGCLSTSKFAQAKIIPAVKHCQHAEFTAIASRNLDSANEAAQRHGIAKAYGSYEELLSDSEIDAIYNPMPNHLHVDWSIKALEAGKHVLCEKPIGLSSAEGQRLLDATMEHPALAKLKVMEAFMYRLHPQWQRVKQLVDAGEIGSLRTIHSFFSYTNRDPNNIRNKADIGGGALMDVGCYNVSLSRFIFGAEPKRVLASADFDPDFKTDRLTSGILEFKTSEFETGTATFTCSTQLAPYQRVHIFGTEGTIEIEIPFNAPPDKPTRIWVQRGDHREEITFEACDQYTIEFDLFSLAALNGTPVATSLEDAVANMKVIEAVFESARKGR